MPVGMLLAGEAVTEESYRRISEKMFGSYPMGSDQAPEGLIIHSAGQSEQGFYVYDIWESREHFQRFADSQLGPAVRELMPDAQAPQPQFFDIETLVHGR